MNRLHLTIVVLVLFLGSGRLRAQGSTNRFDLSLLPPANTVMVTQTVQSAFVSVKNAALFTNLTVKLQVGAVSTPLLDDGNPPDAMPGDATFSGDFTVPALPTSANFVALFITAGNDLSVTNDLGELLPESLVTMTNRVTYVAVVRPGNDNFAAALKIPAAGGLILASNVWATVEPAEPFHGNDPAVAASVWWSWSPTASARVLVDTAGSSFEPVLGVYTGASLATLSLVAWSTNDVENGLKANVVFDAKAGLTYRIAVAGYDDSGVGNIHLRVAPGGLPDNQPPMINIISPGSESLVTTNLLTVTGTAKDMEPNATGIAEVQVQLNDQPPLLATGTTYWQAVLDLPFGTNVIRAVAQDLAGNLSRPSVVVVRYINPTNDDFAAAIELPDVAGTVSASNQRASKELGEPAHAGNEGGRSLWYYFRAPTPGSLRLSTAGSDFDTLLAVYTGDSVANLTLVAANDDAQLESGYSELTATLAAGQVYHIAVDGFGGAAGTLRLAYTFSTTLNYVSLNLLPSLGGTVAPPSGLYVLGSTQYVTALPARDFRFVRWDGSVSSTDNPLTLVMTQNYTLTAYFRVITYTDGFESGAFGSKLAWSTAGPAPWFVQSDVVAGGRFAARSGAIGDGQQSSLVLDVALAGGTGSFDVKVSSEAGWDQLDFYLNGLFQQRWSGQTDWQNYQFAVRAGINHLEWHYVKDANFSAGLDAAFLDNLYLPLPDSSLAAWLSISSLLDGSFQIQVQGTPERTYAIEASPNLRNWTEVYRDTPASGSFVWVDLPATNRPIRFYRAVLR
jgi:hypothetical protein